MKKCLLSVALVFVILTTFSNLAIGNNSTLLFFESDSNKYEIDTTFKLYIKISDVSDLFGYSINLDYDETKLVLLEVSEGDFLNSTGKETVFKNTIDSVKGEILIASALLGKSNGVTGNGTLFTIIFKGKFPGKCNFKFLSSYLKNSSLSDIPFNVADYSIEIFKIEAGPVLSIDTSTLDFGNINFGDTPSLKFNIINSGKGELQGEISSLNPWIKVNPQKFYGNTEVTVTIVTTLVAPNSSYNGEIKIRSNAGEASVIVKVYIVQEISKEPPSLKILTPENNLLTRENRVFILCETKPGCFASINGQKVPVDIEDGIFWYNANLKEGTNTFEISVWDAYENKRSDVLTIIRDTTPPQINVDNIPLLVNIEEITISGKTDPDAILTFNNSPVELKVDGTFTVKYKVEGEVNQLVFTTSDSLGNKKIVVRVFFYSPPLKNKIILKVDSKIASFNGINFTLDVPPIVYNGRVMVPVRAIADIFGADVNWISTEKKVIITLRLEKIVLTIGVNSANFNGNEVFLDSPPIIQNERVMVPVRFISEAFKSQVDWDAATKTVIIKF